MGSRLTEAHIQKTLKISLATTIAAFPLLRVMADEDWLPERDRLSHLVAR